MDIGRGSGRSRGGPRFGPDIDDDAGKLFRGWAVLRSVLWTLGNLLADANGNLFGTTACGGPSNMGTVFEIVKTASGYASTPTILYNFDGIHGAFPYGGLIDDASGNLFGTTSQGGANDSGTVFEIVKTVNGYAGVPTVLVSFDYYAYGAGPDGLLLADAN